MLQVSIRSATQDDLDECLRFERMATEYRQTSLDKILMSAAIESGWVLLAETEGIIVGSYRVDFIWPNKEPFAVWCAIEPEMRNKGLGKLFVKEVCSRLGALGFKRLLTSSCRPHLFPSLERIGYKKIGKIQPSDTPEEVFFEYIF